MRATTRRHAFCRIIIQAESERGPDTCPDPRSERETAVLHREALAALMRESSPNDDSATTLTMPAPTIPIRCMVPRTLKSLGEIAELPIDPRRAFLLSFVDGQHSVGEIVDACGMPDALPNLVELAAEGVIQLN